MQPEAPRKINKANQLSMPQLPGIFTPQMGNAPGPGGYSLQYPQAMGFPYFPSNYTTTNSGGQVQMMPVQMVPVMYYPYYLSPNFKFNQNSNSPFQMAGQQVIDKSRSGGGGENNNNNNSLLEQPGMYYSMAPPVQQQIDHEQINSFNQSAVYQAQQPSNKTDPPGNVGEQGRIGTHATNYINKSKSQLFRENDLKSQYKTILQQQMKQKELDKQQEKQNEKQLELNQILNRQNNDWFGRQGCGAPLRDQFGNVRTSRKNPYNPNYQMQQWFGQAPNSDMQVQAQMMQQQQLQQLQQQPPAQLQPQSGPLYQYNQGQQPQTQQQFQEMPAQAYQLPQPQQQQPYFAEDNNILMPNSLQQQQQQANQPSQSMQTLQTQPQQQLGTAMQNLRTITVSTAQTQGEYGMDPEQVRKRQLAMQVQRQQQEQMELKKMKKEQEKLDQKRERDLEDLKLQREKAEKEQKMMLEYADRSLQNRNLQETNFDQKDLKKLYLAKHQPPEMYDLDTMQRKQQPSRRRRPTPLEEMGKRGQNGQRGDVIIEQRIIKELPIEITKSVKDTVNQQLLKLRNELNFTSNHLGEQLLNLKGQLMKATHQHTRIDEDIKNISTDVRKTQEINEIRQREIYNAFVKNNDNYLLHQTEKIIEPEQVQMAKRVPDQYKYLMYDDPYNTGALGIESDQARRAADDMVGILKNDSRIITLLPLDKNRGNMPDPQIANQQVQLDQQLLQQSLKFNNAVDVADAITDYREWDKSLVGKGVSDHDNINPLVLGYDNQERLTKLVEIDEHQNKGNYDQADKALYDLVTQNKNKKIVFDAKHRDSDQYNLKELDEFVSFQSKKHKYQ